MEFSIHPGPVIMVKIIPKDLTTCKMCLFNLTKLSPSLQIVLKMHLMIG